MKTLMMTVWVLALLMTLGSFDGSVALATDDEAVGDPKPIKQVTNGAFFEDDDADDDTYENEDEHTSGEEEPGA